MITGRRRLLDALRRFITGGGLPAFGLTLLVLWEMLLLALLLAPGGETGLGAFADEFRVWCFGSDPVTGQAAWYDLRVRIEKAPADEKHRIEPAFPTLTSPRGLQAPPRVLRYSGTLSTKP